MKNHYYVKHYEAPSAPTAKDRLKIGWMNAERKPSDDKNLGLRFDYLGAVQVLTLTRIDVERLRDFLTETLDDWTDASY